MESKKWSLVTIRRDKRGPSEENDWVFVCARVSGRNREVVPLKFQLT